MTPQRWVSSTPGFQPTITQRLKTVLLDAGHEELLDELDKMMWTDTINALEERVHVLERDMKIAKQNDIARWTETGIWNVVKHRLDAETVHWVKWGIRISVSSVGAAMLTGLGWLIERIFFK